MTEEALPWPGALAGTPAVSVIEKAIGRGRLSHSLLLAGEDPECLAAAAMAIADRLLKLGSDPSAPRYPADRHPDCFQVRPAGKSRSILAGAVRELVGRVNVASSVSRNKVAVFHDADRMNAAASNILLKTLEEPPARTTILLLTGRPHALLPTILSRVLHFRFPGMSAPITSEGWPEWIADYRAWLGRLGQGVATPRAAADGVLALYGLVARFASMLDKASVAEMARRKETLPEGLEDDELEAIEAEIAVGLRLRMFAAVEAATSEHYRTLIGEPGSPAGRLGASATDSLERAASLLRVNLNGAAALEDFLLASLRIWSRR
jgi:DNA polymerase-3 subunit delta'